MASPRSKRKATREVQTLHPPFNTYHKAMYAWLDSQISQTLEDLGFALAPEGEKGGKVVFGPAAKRYLKGGL